MDILRKECNYSDSVSAYGCLGVLSVDFEHVTFQYLVLVAECQSVGKLQDAEIFRITQATFIPLSRRAKLELVQELSKLLSSGQFYFSYPSYGANFDLLSCAQKQGTDQPHFFWWDYHCCVLTIVVLFCQKFTVLTSVTLSHSHTHTQHNIFFLCLPLSSLFPSLISQESQPADFHEAFWSWLLQVAVPCDVWQCWHTNHLRRWQTGKACRHLKAQLRESWNQVQILTCILMVAMQAYSWLWLFNVACWNRLGMRLYVHVHVP